MTGFKNILILYCAEMTVFVQFLVIHHWNFGIWFISFYRCHTRKEKTNSTLCKQRQTQYILAEWKSLMGGLYCTLCVHLSNVGSCLSLTGITDDITLPCGRIKKKMQRWALFSPIKPSAPMYCLYARAGLFHLVAAWVSFLWQTACSPCAWQPLDTAPDPEKHIPQAQYM